MAMEASTFICAICQSLAYKPVVLDCGQVYCFWCIHDLLTGLKKAKCPDCRDIFHHIPRVCPLLHSLLGKIYPTQYKERETEFGEKERTFGVLPQQVEGGELVESDGFRVSDFTCGTCNQLLVGPRVLNCGHVSCGMCILLVDGLIRCPLCQHAHPSRTPQVCTELRNFLREHFPEEYAAREGEGLGELLFQHEGVLPIDVYWRGANAVRVHAKAGCDSCGMYPIVGVRHRCLDCKEDVGFDLCGKCHETGLVIEGLGFGRYNQQHKPEHKFEILGSSSSRNTMLYLLRGSHESSEDEVQYVQYVQHSGDDEESSLRGSHESSEDEVQYVQHSGDDEESSLRGSHESSEDEVQYVQHSGDDEESSLRGSHESSEDEVQYVQHSGDDEESSLRGSHESSEDEVQYVQHSGDDEESSLRGSHESSEDEVQYVQHSGDDEESSLRGSHESSEDEVQYVQHSGDDEESSGDDEESSGDDEESSGDVQHSGDDEESSGEDEESSGEDNEDP